MGTSEPDEFDREATVEFFDAAGMSLLNGCTAFGHRY